MGKDEKPDIQIRTVRALKDNYCYLVFRTGSKLAVVIDPSESAPILSALRSLDLHLGLILNTHHHHDHVGGNLELSVLFKAPVYCSSRDADRVPNVTQSFRDGDTFEFDGITFNVLEIPGHTEGQIAFWIKSASAVFVGDTVFEMGCGRLFEGTPAQMFASLARLQTLPLETQIYFGHEYTETNARFAKSVEPANANAIENRLAEVRSQLTTNGYAGAPSLKIELAVNPFLRAKTVDDFARLRERRNSFQ